MPISDGWPLPEDVQNCLRRGEPVQFPEFDPDEPADTKRKREISAEWISSLANLPKGFVASPIVIRNATITGDLTLRYTDFESEVRFERCQFAGAIDLSFSIFAKSVVFDGSTFTKQLLINGIRTTADLDLTGCTFNGVVEGQDSTIGRNLNAQGTRFNQDCKFEGLGVGGFALFKDDDSKPSVFRGDVEFDVMHVDGGLDLEEAEFHGAAHFTCATVKNFADLKGATFRGRAQFDGVAILGDSNFENAQFLAATTDPKDVLIRFPGIRITGQSVFDNALFASDVRFDLARFEAEALFESARFCGRTRFDDALFAGPARFNNASFVPLSSEDQIDFRGARAGVIEFKGARFLSGLVSFQDASFKTAYFRDGISENVPTPDQRQFPVASKGRIDLRGFTYDRIFIAWREILSILEPYDVQPYRQIERALRTMGESRSADRIYLKQRWRGFRLDIKRRKWLNAVATGIYGSIARFGVRPWRLVFISILLLFCSIWIFHKNGSVLPSRDSDCIAHTLDYREALGVSLNNFLPIQVPVAQCWVPTRRAAVNLLGYTISYALWGSMLKIAGWIVVPLGLAGLGGVLRRDPLK